MKKCIFSTALKVHLLACPQALNCITVSGPWDEIVLSNYSKSQEGTLPKLEANMTEY